MNYENPPPYTGANPPGPYPPYGQPQGGPAPYPGYPPGPVGYQPGQPGYQGYPQPGWQSGQPAAYVEPPKNTVTHEGRAVNVHKFTDLPISH